MITKEEVKHIAYLARIELNEQEVEMFTQQLLKILQYMEQLNEIDTKNVEPLSHVVKIECELRTDEKRQECDQTLLLKNAPESEGDFFKVKKVIE